jgi:hypothetical protein
MTDALVGQIITGVVTLGLALIGYLKLKSGQVKAEGKMDTYHKEVDGMKTELVEAVRGKAAAEGEIKGAEKNQAETDSKPQEKK